MAKKWHKEYRRIAKAEAYILFYKGTQQYNNSQFRAALQSWQQALTRYREIRDRKGEGTSLGNLGNAYDSLGEYQKAIDYYQQSLSIAQEIGDRKEEGTCLGNLGATYHSLGEYQKAIDYHQQSLSIAREIGERSLEGDSLIGLGNAYYSLRESQRAINYYQQSLSIQQKIGDRNGEGYSLGCLGDVYNFLGEYQRAIDYYQQSISIAQEIGDRKGEGISLGNLGNAYDYLGEYQKAIDYYQQSLSIAQEIGDRKDEGMSLGNLGATYHSLGEYQKAIDYHQQSLSIARELGNRKGEGYSLGHLGNAYDYLGEYQKAINYHQQSLSIAREIGDRSLEGDSLNNLGNAYYSLGEYQKTIDYYQQSLSIAREVDDRKGESTSLGNLGNAYDPLGEYQKAIDYYQQSLSIAREVDDRKGESTLLGNLGSAYNSLGEYQRAIDYCEQSLSIQQKIGDRKGEGNSLNDLGNAYNSLGEYQRAIDYCQQSLSIQQKIGDRNGEGSSLSSLGNAYDYLGEYQRAIDYYQQSLSIAREIGDHSMEGNSLNDLGNAYHSLGEYQRAIDYYQQSLSIAREIGDRKGEGSSLGNLGNAYNSLGEYQRAIDYHQQSLSIAREIGDRKGVQISLNNLGEVFLKTNQLVEATAKLYAALDICETLRSGLVKSDHKVSIFETQVKTYRLLQQVLVAQKKYDIALDIAERGRTRTFVELLRERSSTPEKVTNIANQKGKAESKPLTQIAQEQNTTIIEYSIVFGDIYIWVIQPTGNITFRRANREPLEAQNKTLDNLDDIILKARVSIGVDERDQQGKKIKCEPNDLRDAQGRYPLLHLLYQILISPIADLLPPDPHTPLIIIPHYGLFLVPFPALQDANNHYLIEQHTILTAPSIEILDLTHQRQQSLSHLNQPALVIGDPTIAEKFTQPPYNLKPIPAAKDAAEEIATLLQTKAITGEEATKAQILNQMKTAPLIHISAHGLLDDFHDSGIPGTIILAPDNTDDGILNAAEIPSLTLNAEFVVLSACSTGKGQITGDGIIGLSRCFILAGVPSLIVSLWNMGAMSAKIVMTEFYNNLAQGSDKATALRQAMLTTKKLFPRPADWAAFTLIGETTPLSLSTQSPEQRKRTMAFFSETTPTETIDAFFNLLETSDLFSDHVSSLDQLTAQPTDTPQDIAQRIEQWCDSRPTIQVNMENELSQMGAGGTDSQPAPEIAAEFNQRLEKNILRLGSPPSSSTNQTKK